MAANVHDSRVDLSRPGEVVYWDRGYFGVKPRGYDATMKRASREHLLGIRGKLRNGVLAGNGVLGNSLLL